MLRMVKDLSDARMDCAIMSSDMYEYLLLRGSQAFIKQHQQFPISFTNLFVSLSYLCPNDESKANTLDVSRII